MYYIYVYIPLFSPLDLDQGDPLIMSEQYKLLYFYSCFVTILSGRPEALFTNMGWL